MKKLFKIVSILIFATLFFACNSSEHAKVNIPEKPFFEKEEFDNPQTNISEINESFDSTIFHYDTKTKTEGSFTSYYKNGRIKKTGHQVNINGCGMLGDTLFFYDTSGNLSKTEFYDNYYPNEGASCHEISSNISIKAYHTNGNLKSTKQIKTCYECEETKIGAWIYFSETGEIDSTIIYTP